MADQEKSILFTIKLDTGDIIVKQAALAKEIENTKKNMNDLKKTSGEGTVEYQKQKAELTNLQTEYNKSNAILKTNQALQNANKGSINSMRAELAKVTAEYNNLSKAERENADVGGKLAASKLSLTNQLKKVEEATGDHRRSVGDYTKALEGTPFGEFIQGISNIGKAFLENPIGLIITAIVAAFTLLKEAFTSNEEGQDKMAKGMAILSAIFKNITAIISKVANYLVDLFENPQESLKKFAELVKENIINRFTGLLELVPQLGKAIVQLFSGDFAEAGKTAANAVGKVVLGVDDLTGKIGQASDALKKFGDQALADAKKAALIADMRDEAERLERDLIVDKAKIEAKIADAREKASDKENLSADERKAAIKNVIGLVTELANKEEKIAKLRLQAIKDENALANGQVVSKEAKTEQANAEAALFNIQRDKSEQLKTLYRDLNKLNGELSQTAQEDTKRRIALIAVESEAWSRAMQKKIDDFNKSTKNEEDQTKLVIAIETERANFIKKISDDTLQGKIKNLDIEHQKQIENLKNSQFLLNGSLEFDQQHAADKLAIDQDYEIKKRQLQQAGVQANLAIAQDGLNSLQVIAGDNFEAQKGIALLQVALDEAKAISSLIASSTANPLNAVTFGAAGIAQFAAGILGLAANIAKVKQIINSAPPPKAEHGIILGGQPHSNGGTMISADGVPIAEAEKGELLTIVNKRSTGMLKSLSNLNQLGGGIPFMANGGIPEFQSGGVAISNDKFSSDNNLVNIFKNLPRPVVAVQHILEAIGKLTDVQDQANV